MDKYRRSDFARGKKSLNDSTLSLWRFDMTLHIDQSEAQAWWRVFVESHVLEPKMSSSSPRLESATGLPQDNVRANPRLVHSRDSGKGKCQPALLGLRNVSRLQEKCRGLFDLFLISNWMVSFTATTLLQPKTFNKMLLKSLGMHRYWYQYRFSTNPGHIAVISIPLFPGSSHMKKK